MNIERNNAAAAPRAVERSAHAPASGQPARQRNAAPEAGTGFGALLDSLSSDADRELVVSLAPADPALPLDTPAIGSPLPGAAAPAVIDATQLLLPDPGLPGALADAPVSSPPTLGTVMALPVAVPSQSLVPGARPPGALQSAGAIDASTRRNGIADPKRGTGQADLLPDSADSALPAAPSDQFARSTIQTSAVADVAQSALRANLAQARRADMQRQLEATALAPTAARRDAEERMPNSATLLLDGLVGGLKTQAGGRDAERKAPPAGSVTGPSWLESSAVGGPSAASATVVFDAGVAAPETVVAKQVHFWVTRGVQNAELQLDAFGGGQVDVHVSVTGNEAQVEFRTDQPDARRLLQDAMPQLRQMLEQEGMLLSGGFVGTSARQDPAPNDRPPARAPARATDSAGEPVAIVGAGLANRTAGRTLDVFV